MCDLLQSYEGSYNRKDSKEGIQDKFLLRALYGTSLFSVRKVKEIMLGRVSFNKNLCLERDISLSICRLEKANQQTSDASNGDEIRTQAEEFSSQRSSPLSTLNLVDTPSRLPQGERRQRTGIKRY